MQMDIRQRQSSHLKPQRVSPHLNLLKAGGELPLLEDHDVVADPLEEEGHQLVVFLPAHLQFLQPAQQKKISQPGVWTTAETTATVTDRRALLLLWSLRVQQLSHTALNPIRGKQFRFVPEGKRGRRHWGREQSWQRLWGESIFGFDWDIKTSEKVPAVYFIG